MWKRLFMSCCLTPVCLAGCGQTRQAPLQTAEGEHGVAHEQGADQIEASLAGLSPDDRAAAVQQRICPVTGEPLGSMGKPPKVTVNGQQVFICCAGCEEDLRANFTTHMAKLKK